MTIMRALVALPKTTGIPEDTATNTWHFDTSSPPTSLQMTDVTTALTSFYQAVDAYYATNVATACSITYYDLADPTPRVPLRTDAMTLAPAGGNPLPEEISVCLSYQAAKISGVPQARRRGRIYLGPFGQTVLGTTAVTSDRPLAAAVTAIANAATALATATAGAVVPWVIYSPTNGSGAVVTDGWVDNAFDTQRRRGVAATSRTLWT